MNEYQKIKLIVYDFDGVMTDNKVYVNEEGNEMVQVNRADGLGVSEIKKRGIGQIIISTEKNPVVSIRADKLNIECLQAIDDKEIALTNYCEKRGIDFEHVAYVGNDINDIDAMKIVGFKFCPSDSHESIKKISDHVFKTSGGNGVIRELLELIN
tara:strand:+ start:545 stop:1009 length:465 start_codon:yes stop_codon:yes gene_type:complete